MKNMALSALSAGLGSTHKFPWKWRLADLLEVQKNGKKVFSTFSCGGGSTMGYKLAGYDVIGNCEIDPDMMSIYKRNHHPQYPFLMDIRDFAALPDSELPPELFQLDILDGSPPCSTFSMAGQRENGWGKEKVFREGQKKQRLDDLFFAYLDVVEKLRPKVSVAENVKGLITGKARGYVREILNRYKELGYDCQLFLLNSGRMGVPQTRERVFFIACREDIPHGKLTIACNEPPITFGEVRTEEGKKTGDGKHAKLLKMRRPGDKSISDIYQRLNGKGSGYTCTIIWDADVAQTLTSGATSYRGYDGQALSDMDCCSIQTFPQDYDFGGQPVKYVCGMSVPPVMMAHIAWNIYKQWLVGDTNERPSEG